jgi:hypothetical protein
VQEEERAALVVVGQIDAEKPAGFDGKCRYYGVSGDQDSQQARQAQQLTGAAEELVNGRRAAR